MLGILLLSSQNSFSQCNVVVDVNNLQHVICPNGGAVGTASLLQGTYTNYSWTNISNGQIYGNGPFVTSVSNLDAGIYVVMGSSPYGGCLIPTMTDTFELYEPSSNIQLSPTQACPGNCNVSATISLSPQISSVSYTYTIDNSSQVPLNSSINNLCGGSHLYEIFANNNSCGVKNFGVSQSASMNLSTVVTNTVCASQNGTAVVSIAGSGSSAVNTYCSSTPQYSNYSNIEFVSLVGDNTSINNNTAGLCDTYQDYTNQSADITPGQSYSIDISLSSCPNLGSIINFNDAAKVFIDWNIDGDFNDLNEEIGTLGPQLTPWTNTITFTVPQGAVPGVSRMRVVGQYNPGSNPTFDACDNTPWFGSTEDYTIVVNGNIIYPVSYLWSNGATTDSIYGLSSGVYSVIVTAANGCEEYDTVTVGVSGNFSSTAILIDTIKCYGDLAIIDVVTSCGSGWYHYSLDYWSPILGGMWLPLSQQTTYDTATFSSVPANNYRIFVTDLSTNSTTTTLINITQPSSLSLGISSASATCYNACDGSVSSGISGGTAPYSYLWSNGSINSSITGLCAGTYSLTVTDSNGCIATDSMNILVNPLPTVAALSVPASFPICSGDTITLTGSGTASIYTWNHSVINGVPFVPPQTWWSNPPVPVITTYIVTGVDTITQCSNSDTIIISVNPIPLASLIATPSPACVGDDIIITAISSIPSTLFYFQYKTGSVWINMTTPFFTTINPITYPAISNTTNFRVKVYESAGCNPSVWSGQITVPISTVVTQPINHY